MNGQDLQIEQNKAYKSMEESKDEALKKEKEMAEHIRQYEMKLAVKMFSLRTDGHPASMVERMAKGDPEIADLKFKATVAEAEAKSARENINIKKRIFDSLEATKKRELG